MKYKINEAICIWNLTVSIVGSTLARKSGNQEPNPDRGMIFFFYGIFSFKKIPILNFPKDTEYAPVYSFFDVIKFQTNE